MIQFEELDRLSAVIKSPGILDLYPYLENAWNVTQSPGFISGVFGKTFKLHKCVCSTQSVGKPMFISIKLQKSKRREDIF